MNFQKSLNHTLKQAKNKVYFPCKNKNRQIKETLEQMNVKIQIYIYVYNVKSQIDRQVEGINIDLTRPFLPC